MEQKLQVLTNWYHIYLPKSAIDKISLVVAKILKEREMFKEDKEKSLEESDQEEDE